MDSIGACVIDLKKKIKKLHGSPFLDVRHEKEREKPKLFRLDCAVCCKQDKV